MTRNRTRLAVLAIALLMLLAGLAWLATRAPYRPAITAQPDKEARIVARRLAEWQQNMQANLDWIRSQVEGVE